MVYKFTLVTLVTLLASSTAQLTPSSEAVSNQMGLTALSGLNATNTMAKTIMTTGTMTGGTTATGTAMAGGSAASTPASSSGGAAPAATGLTGYGVGAAVGMFGLLMAI